MKHQRCRKPPRRLYSILDIRLRFPLTLGTHQHSNFCSRCKRTRLNGQLIISNIACCVFFFDFFLFLRLWQTDFLLCKVLDSKTNLVPSQSSLAAKHRKILNQLVVGRCLNLFHCCLVRICFVCCFVCFQFSFVCIK